MYFWHAAGGGTGGGFAIKLLHETMEIFPEKRIAQFASMTIFPSASMPSSIIEPYNTVMTCHKLLDMDRVRFCVCFDNHKLYTSVKELCGITSPEFYQMNQLIARVFSSMTMAQRFSMSAGGLD